MAFIDDSQFLEGTGGDGQGHDSPLPSARQSSFDVEQLLMNFELNEPIFENELLNPTPVESEIMHFDYEGNLLKGTLEGIICFLSSPEVMSYTNMVDFFLTFRSIIDPVPFMELILCRLSWALKSDNDLVTIRTFVCLRHWILNHFQDFINDQNLRSLFVNTINEMCKYEQYMNSIVKMNTLRDLKRSFIKSCEVSFTTHVDHGDEDVLYVDLDQMDTLPRLSKIALMQLNDPSTRRSGILSMIDNKNSSMNHSKLENMIPKIIKIRNKHETFKHLESLNSFRKPTKLDPDNTLDILIDHLKNEVKSKPLKGIVKIDDKEIEEPIGFSINGKIEIFQDSNVTTIKKERDSKPARHQPTPAIPQNVNDTPKPVKAQPQVADAPISKEKPRKNTFLKNIFGKRQPLKEVHSNRNQQQHTQKPDNKAKQGIKPMIKQTVRSSAIIYDLESAIDPQGKIDYISELILKDYQFLMKSHSLNKKRLSVPISFKESSEIIDWSNTSQSNLEITNNMDQLEEEDEDEEFIDMNYNGTNNGPILVNEVASGWSVGSRERSRESYITYDSSMSNSNSLRHPGNNDNGGLLKRKQGINNLRLESVTPDGEDYEEFNANEFETSSGLNQSVDNYNVDVEPRAIAMDITEGSQSSAFQDESEDFADITPNDIYINPNDEMPVGEIEVQNELVFTPSQLTTPVKNEFNFSSPVTPVTPVRIIQLNDNDTEDVHDQKQSEDHRDSRSTTDDFQASYEEHTEADMVNISAFTQHEAPLHLELQPNAEQPNGDANEDGSSFLVGFGNGPDPIPEEKIVAVSQIIDTKVNPMEPEVTPVEERFTFEINPYLAVFSELPFNENSIQNDNDQISMISSQALSQGKPNYNGISQTDINQLADLPDFESHNENPIGWALNKLRGNTPKLQQDEIFSSKTDGNTAGAKIVYGLNDEHFSSPNSPILDSHQKHAIGFIARSPIKENDLERQIRDLYITKNPSGDSALPLEMISRSGSRTSKLLLHDDNRSSNFDISSLMLLPRDKSNIDAIMKDGKHIPFILEYDLATILNQFTLIERDLMMEIDWKELINLKFDNILTPFNSWLRVLIDETNRSGVELVTLRFNLMTNWVKSEILLCKDLSLRILTMTKFIELAWLGLKSQNFMIVFQVMFALNSDICKDLKSTWSRVDPGAILKFKRLKDFTSPLNNYQFYRNQLEKAKMSFGVIPFLPLDLNDLTINSELPTIIRELPEREHEEETSQNEDEDEEEEDECYDLINFKKLQTGCAIAKSVIRVIEWSKFLNPATEENIMARCLYIGCLSEEEMMSCLNLLD